MSDNIEMIADEPPVPSFGSGATRVLSENELDGLLEATVSASDVNHPRAPKETKRIEALARIAPVIPGAAGTEPAASSVTAEAALLDAAYSRGVLAVDASTKPSDVSTPDRRIMPVAPTASRSWWRDALWIVLIVAAILGAAAAVRARL